MSEQILKDKLIEIDTPACDEAMEWATGLTVTQAWEQCPRADWLLWLVHKMSNHPQREKLGWPTREEIVLAVCDCEKTSEGKMRPSIAKRTVRDRSKKGKGRGRPQRVCDAAEARAGNAAYARATAIINDSVGFLNSKNPVKKKAHQDMCDTIRNNLKIGKMPD